MSISDCRTVRPESQLVRLSDGKIVGWFDGDAFIKPVVGSKHRLRRPPAWAIDAEVFDEQIRHSTKEIVISDREADAEWKVSVEHFELHKGTLDRGHGVQYFLPLKHWHVEDNGGKQLSLWGADNG